jgi:hypothetical protein
MKPLTKKVIKSFLTRNIFMWLVDVLVCGVLVLVLLWPPPDLANLYRIVLIVLLLVLIVTELMCNIKDYRSILRYLGYEDKEYCHEHGILCPEARKDILKDYTKFYKREDFVQCSECKKVVKIMYDGINKTLSDILVEPSK